MAYNTFPGRSKQQAKLPPDHPAYWVFLWTLTDLMFIRLDSSVRELDWLLLVWFNRMWLQQQVLQFQPAATNFAA